MTPNPNVEITGTVTRFNLEADAEGAVLVVYTEDENGTVGRSWLRFRPAAANALKTRAAGLRDFPGHLGGSTDAEQPGPIAARCPAALPTDPTPCDGAPAVTVFDAFNAGAEGCERHGAHLIALLAGGRVYALPDAPRGAALRVHRSAGTGRPVGRVASFRELVTVPAAPAAPPRPCPRFTLEPGWVDVDVPGWQLTGDKGSGEYLSDCHETFRPDDSNADIEAAMDWAEQLIGARQEWFHFRERGFERWEAGTRD
ncbi:hypothetical protein ACFY0G_40465 [Streptomyces sp. NPDC001552]|uniref:hypothetical protein n=1 Tax=Streptomyces sp. NPDC001552 TaxID=3364587 RepID=UPI0036AD05BC